MTESRARSVPPAPPLPSVLAGVGRPASRSVELAIFLLGWTAFYTWFFRSVGRESSASSPQRLDGGAA